MKRRLAICIGAFEYGGQGQVVSEELTHLQDRYRTSLIAHRINREVPPGIEATVIPYPQAMPRPSASLVALLRTFDLIHCHDSFQLMRAASRSGRPWVVTAHGICPPRHRNSTVSAFSAAATTWLYPRLYARANQVVAISDYVCAWLRTLRLMNPLVIRNGVNVASQERPAHGPQPLNLLYVGEISRRKGIDVLLDAMRICPITVSLVAVGRGEVERYRAIVNKDPLLLGRVIFTGELSSGELQLAYERAFAVFSASYWEGFGLPIIEGFAHGIPALVRCQGGLEELIRLSGGGLCFETLESIPRLLDILQHDWDKLCVAAFNYAIANPWSNTFDQYDALFQNLLSQ
ncbi:MAG: glycosyltransferase family 4 protein [Acidimicrobiales bacterium]